MEKEKDEKDRFGEKVEFNERSNEDTYFAVKEHELLEEMKSEFHIKGMHCESCAVDIKETLEETAGVQSADVTFSGKTAVEGPQAPAAQEKAGPEKAGPARAHC